MKIHKLLILAAAAWAGTMVYKAQRSFTAPGTSDVPGSSTIPSQGLYSSVTGSGSLAATIKEGSDERDAILSGDTSTAKPSFRSRTSTIKSPSSSKKDQPADDAALIFAASTGDIATVEKRLAGHSKVDSRDNLRRTPLMYASWNGYSDLCSRLLAAGANPEFQDRMGNNSFDYAAGRGLFDMLNFLLHRTQTTDTEHYAEYAKLIQAVFAGDPTLLPEGTGKLASINRINPEDQAPLHIASGNGSIELIAALIQRGADVNIANNIRQTPLHWAAWNNQTEALELLIKHGGDVSAHDVAGNTPLILAAQSGSADAAILLLRKGADRYAANKQGKTAAIIAEDYRFQDLANLLK
jgi:uncharacterized protein